MSSIVLKTEHRRAIAQHGEAAYPQECRGFLLGHSNGLSKEVIELVLIDNETEIAGQNGDRYSISNERLQEGEQVARDHGLQVIGLFHSHVDQPARPSIHERDYAEPEFSYVIVGIRQGRAHELAAWKLSEDGTAFFQEDIRKD